MKPVGKRCLILNCSQRKLVHPSVIPAIERYTGPAFQVLKRYLRNADKDSAAQLDIYILSAKFGLISANHPIQDYNQRMTAERAIELQSCVDNQLAKTLAVTSYQQVFVSVTQDYAVLLTNIEQLCSDATTTWSNGGIGQKQANLYEWLWGAKSSRSNSSVAMVSNDPITLRLRGHVLTSTTDGALEKIRTAVSKTKDLHYKTKKWAISIEDQNISPKWAVRVLFECKDVKFSSEEARRILHRLGIRCFQL